MCTMNECIFGKKLWIVRNTIQSVVEGAVNVHECKNAVKSVACVGYIVCGKECGGHEKNLLEGGTCVSETIHDVRSTEQKP